MSYLPSEYAPASPKPSLLSKLWQNLMLLLGEGEMFSQGNDADYLKAAKMDVSTTERQKKILADMSAKAFSSGPPRL